VTAFVGLGAFLLMLFLWLKGHWFGRVIAFLFGGCLFSFLALLLWAGIDPPFEGGYHGGPHRLLVIPAAFLVSWFISSIPQRFLFSTAVSGSR
jgi:hypothetical protein